jgi:hypothetical protein
MGMAAVQDDDTAYFGEIVEMEVIRIELVW